MKARLSLKTRASLGNPERKRRLNRELFAMVAPRYDAVTRLLSFGRDRCWKDRLIGMLPEREHPDCLDLACGTGDLARRLARRYPQGRILGLDLTPEMVALANKQAHDDRLQFKVGDMGRTELADASIDLVTGGYALRNAGDLGEAIREVSRVLKPGGSAAFLDFSKSPHRLTQRLSLAVLRFWGGLWGWLLHGNPDVYAYIAESLSVYPDRTELAAHFGKAGLRIVQTRRFFGGMIETVLLGKPEAGPS